MTTSAADRRRPGEPPEVRHGPFHTFRIVARNPDLRRLQLGLGAAVLGGGGYQIALAAVAFSQGGAGSVGIAFAIQMAPLALASPFTAVLADRFPRRLVLVTIDVLRVACTASVAIAVSRDAPLWLVLVLGAPGAVASTAQQPATQALLPSTVSDPSELSAANVVERGIVEATALAGPALAAVVIALAGPAAVFGCGAVGFAVSGFLVSRITVGREVPMPDVEPVSRRHEALAGIRAIGADSQLALLIGLVTVMALATGLVQVFSVLIARTILHHGSSYVGELYVAMGIGGLLSTIVMASLAVRARLSSAIAAGTTLLFAGLVLIAATPGDVTALAGLAAVGAGNVLADVGLITMLQRVVPEEVLARVFGIAGGALIGMVGLGALLGPTLRESFGGRPALAITAALPAITIALAWRKLRGVDHHDQDHIDRVALLRQVPTFAPLPNDTLSELEAALRPIHATAGEEIVRQGDQGNDYFVVAAGVCEATIDGHPVALHGPGDGFGEIALLRDTPRSATVTASEDSELYALNRTTFLALLAGHASAAAAAEGIAARRLARLRPGAP